MDMCYDGALVMPSSYAVMDVEEMMYVDGGGKVIITIKKSTINAAISGTLGFVTKAVVIAALSAVMVGLAAGIELGTAGIGTGIAGTILIYGHKAAAALAGTIVANVSYGVYRGGNQTFTLYDGWMVKGTQRLTV